jgi:hypothetical protein
MVTTGGLAPAPQVRAGYRLAAVGSGLPGRGRKCGWLWVLVAADSVSHMMAESRSTAVLIEHLSLDPSRRGCPKDAA